MCEAAFFARCRSGEGVIGTGMAGIILLYVPPLY